MAIDPHTSPHAPNGADYETRDANPSSLLKFGAGLIVLLLVVAFGMKLMFGYFGQTQTLGPEASPFENARTLPPSPKLQTAPQKEIHDYWEAQHDTLNSYGWVDRQNAVVRIPIDRAMRLILERGLPARPGGTAPDAALHTAAPPDQGKSAQGSEQ